MKRLILLIMFSFSYANAQYQPESYGEVDAKARAYVDVSVANTSKEPIFCKQVSVDVVYENPGQMVLSRKRYNLSNIYLEASEIFKESIGADEYQKLLLKHKYVFIRDFQFVESNGCYKPKFSEYCDFAKKSKEEETTLKSMSARLGQTSCAGIQNVIENTNTFVDQNSYYPTLFPFSYFTNLNSLEIINSGVAEIRGIEKLSSLKKLNISSNISFQKENDLKSLYSLMNLNLSNTGIQNIDFVGNMGKLQILDIRGTKVNDLSSLNQPNVIQCAFIEGLMVYKNDVNKKARAKYEKPSRACRKLIKSLDGGISKYK